MLAPSSQGCMRAAYRIYSGILDEVEAQDHDVFLRRATVPRWRRLAIALSCVLGVGAAVPGGSPPEPAAVDVPQQRDAPGLLDVRGTAA